METKKDETKTVNMNGKQEAPAATALPVEPVYKFVPESYNKLGAYLLTRPIREVQTLYQAFFRHGQKDPFYKQQAVDALLDYLTQCPMGEVEPILSELQKGGLQQYMPQVDENGVPIQNAPGTEAKEGENKENPAGEQK